MELKALFNSHTVSFTNNSNNKISHYNVLKKKIIIKLRSKPIMLIFTLPNNKILHQ